MDYLLSKTLPLALLPLGLSLLLLGLLARWRWPVITAGRCCGYFPGAGEPDSLTLVGGTMATTAADA